MCLFVGRSVTRSPCTPRLGKTDATQAGIVFLLRRPFGHHYDPVRKYGRRHKTRYNCTGPFNWGEAHFAGETGETGERKEGPTTSDKESPVTNQRLARERGGDIKRQDVSRMQKKEEMKMIKVMKRMKMMKMMTMMEMMEMMEMMKMISKTNICK